MARDGGVIRDGVDAELDDLRSISRSNKQHIAAMEDAERARTGISSLKIRYNRVFGYYIEISKSNLGNVPPDYHRKQTIAGGERFITPALKDYEEKVLGADERMPRARESRSSSGCAPGSPPTRRGFRRPRAGWPRSTCSPRSPRRPPPSNYTKPMMHAGDDLVAVDVRHPVVERHVADAFVPNDVTLDAGARQLIVLTGPNMGGKSTYLRQTALLCLMAQAGSFVPARSAKLPVVDRIFARVGASDNIARGQSTFMVEMQETANILHSATSRSLLILDEIGRGTSTFDGLEPRLGGRRAPGVEPARAAEDHLRDPLSRAHGSGRRAPQRHQLPRRRARVAGRHRVPAQGGAGTIRSQLRHPGGAARRPAADAWWRARARSSTASSATSCRAAAVRRSTPSAPADRAAVSSGSSRRRRRPRIRSSGGSRRSTSTI